MNSRKIRLKSTEKYKKEKNVTKNRRKIRRKFVFAIRKLQFCRKRTGVMKRFENLCARMLRVKYLAEPKMDFSILCMHSGISSREADDMFYRLYGMSGAEVMESLCRDNRKAKL